MILKSAFEEGADFALTEDMTISQTAEALRMSATDQDGFLPGKTPLKTQGYQHIPEQKSRITPLTGEKYKEGETMVPTTTKYLNYH